MAEQSPGSRGAVGGVGGGMEGGWQNEHVAKNITVSGAIFRNAVHLFGFCQKRRVKKSVQFLHKLLKQSTTYVTDWQPNPRRRWRRRVRRRRISSSRRREKREGGAAGTSLMWKQDDLRVLKSQVAVKIHHCPA